MCIEIYVRDFQTGVCNFTENDLTVMLSKDISLNISTLFPITTRWAKNEVFQ